SRVHGVDHGFYHPSSRPPAPRVPPATDRREVGTGLGRLMPDTGSTCRAGFEHRSAGQTVLDAMHAPRWVHGVDHRFYHPSSGPPNLPETAPTNALPPASTFTLSTM